jgi:hypothetical protein
MRGYLDTLEMSDHARRGHAAPLLTVRGDTPPERIVMDLVDLARYENGVAPLETQYRHRRVSTRCCSATKARPH